MGFSHSQTGNRSTRDGTEVLYRPLKCLFLLTLASRLRREFRSRRAEKYGYCDGENSALQPGKLPGSIEGPPPIWDICPAS
jgi:hypothetical protein